MAIPTQSLSGPITPQPLAATATSATSDHARPLLLGLPLARGLAVVDSLAVSFALLLTVALGVGASAEIRADWGRLFIIGALAVTWPTTLWLGQTRRSTIMAAGLEEYRRVLVACGITAVVVAASAFLFVDSSGGRRCLVFAAIVGTFTLLLGRWLSRRVVVRTVSQGVPLSRVFVVAFGTHSKAIQREIRFADGRLEVAGSMAEASLRPDPQQVLREAAACGADAIVVGPDVAADPQWLRRLGWAMESSELSLMVSPAITAVAGPRLSIENVQGMALVRIEMPKFDGSKRLVKRALDIVGSAIGLVLLSIPMLLVALAIRIDSRGPALFKQERAGRDGTSFTCWKFRTMTVDASGQREHLRSQIADDRGAFKLRQDPRITPLGRILRRCSIDELPQLVNVLLGQMSLVGPRPHPFDDVERYDEVATRRLLSKPGITGLWQVSGRCDLDWERSVMLDLNYVENWSLSMDAVILMKTLAAVIRGQGAY